MLILPQAPQFGHLLRIEQLEFALIISPGDNVFILVLVNQELEQKLPECYVGLHVVVVAAAALLLLLLLVCECVDFYSSVSLSSESSCLVLRNSLCCRT